MKKVICFILACLLMFGIAGCTSEKTNNSTDSTISSTDTESISQGEVSAEASTNSESTSEETSAVAKPIDNTGVPEEFWECENVAADMESFASEDAYSDEYYLIKWWPYTFLNAYLSGDKDLIDPVSLSDYFDEACLARFPKGESAYGSFDDMEHYYFKDIRCLYDADQTISCAWMKTVFALKGQFYELTLSLETKERRWVIVDFAVAETEIEPAELQTDVVELQDLAFRFFRAFCHGDLEAARTMVDDPNNRKHSALEHCDKVGESLQETSFWVSMFINEKGGVGIIITFSEDNEPKAWYMHLGFAAEEVKGEAGNVIDRVWKITGCGIEA